MHSLENIRKEILFESERLKTSSLNEEDIESLFQMYSDHEAMKYRGSKPMITISDAHFMVANQTSEKGSISKLRLGIRTKTTNIF